VRLDPILEIAAGVLAGCGLGFLMFEVGLWAVSQPFTAISFGPVVVFVTYIAPTIVAALVFWKKKVALFSAAMIVASVVTAGWLWSFVYAQFGTFL